MSAITQGSLQTARSARGRFWESLRARPVPPLLPVQHKAGGIDRVAPPGGGVALLPVGIGPRSEPIRPAEPVPIVHVKDHRHYAFPQLWIVLQPAHPLIRRRATTT